MVIAFCVFSMVGHWMEIPYCMFNDYFFGTVEEDTLVFADPFYPFCVYGIAAVFGGQVGGAPLRMSRCRVLASAALEQDSYRIRYSLPDGESVNGTVFARALCEAGGWDMSTDARSALRADRDYDGQVTLAELYGYLRRRMTWILAQGNTHRVDGLPVSAQTVQLWPETAADVVFARTEP